MNSQARKPLDSGQQSTLSPGMGGHHNSGAVHEPAPYNGYGTAGLRMIAAL